MILDIKRTVIRTQLRRFITLIVFILLLMPTLFWGGWGGWREQFWGIDRSSLALWLCLIYVVFLTLESVFELNYIYFSDKGDKIIFRYFSMSVMNRKKNSIVIDKAEFGGYKVKYSLWGLKRKIILLHRIKNNDAPYPAVSITGLSQAETQQMLTALDRWKVKK